MTNNRRQDDRSKTHLDRSLKSDASFNVSRPDHVGATFSRTVLLDESNFLFF